FPEARLARQHTGFQEVVPHELLRGFSALRIFVTELLCDLLLEFKLKDVEVAACSKMQKVSNAVVKIQCLCRKQMAARGFNRLSNPAGPVHITQAAGGLLEIRLELIDGVAELPVTTCLHRHEGFQKPIAVFLHETRKDLAFKLLGCGAIAQQE